MSDGWQHKDDIPDLFFDDVIDDESISPPKEDELVWTTASGEKLKLSEMSDSHLLNTIEYLRRHGSRLEMRSAMRSELDRRKVSHENEIKLGATQPLTDEDGNEIIF